MRPGFVQNSRPESEPTISMERWAQRCMRYWSTAPPIRPRTSPIFPPASTARGSTARSPFGGSAQVSAEMSPGARSTPTVGARFEAHALKIAWRRAVASPTKAPRGFSSVEGAVPPLSAGNLASKPEVCRPRLYNRGVAARKQPAEQEVDALRRRVAELEGQVSEFGRALEGFGRLSANVSSFFWVYEVDR